jgi:phosphoserine phosphatase
VRVGSLAEQAVSLSLSRDKEECWRATLTEPNEIAMAKKKPHVAISYDFDGTLAPGNMQEHSFISSIKMKKHDFWAEVARLSEEHQADNILVYLGLMIEKADQANVRFGKKDFVELGKKLELFPGVVEWFDRINKYGDEAGVKVDHYIISSGVREIIEGSAIGRKFSRIYASGYWYDQNGVAKWPAMAINYTTKTQYLFRINKGTLDVHDHKIVNEFVPKSERPVPFENMIYIGDGETDVPCFRLVKDQGGHSISVYKPRDRNAKATSEKLLSEGRVNFAAPANYQDGNSLDQVVKGIIDKIAADQYLYRLGKL